MVSLGIEFAASQTGLFGQTKGDHMTAGRPEATQAVVRRILRNLIDLIRHILGVDRVPPQEILRVV